MSDFFLVATAFALRRNSARTLVRLLALTMAMLMLGGPVWAQSIAIQLEIIPAERNGWIRLNAPFQSNTLLRLQASPDLLTWAPFATLHDGAFAYPDAEAGHLTQRFYRGFAQPKTAIDDWKNQIVLPNESFRSASSSSNEVRWVKFAILASDPTKVFYQDSVRYPFHYEFATQRLPPFLGMDRTTFDQLSLHPATQQVILGAVLLPPAGTTLEYGIQFVGLEPYPPGTVANLLDLVSATIYSPVKRQPLYIPAWEQFDSASANEAFFEDHGFPLASTDRWVGGSTVYAAGWALGRLVFIPAPEITAAYTDGRLLPGDILLTDGVPAEVPLVAGIISLRPSTPNSHVAILARSFGIPFVYLPDAGERTRVEALDGHEVVFRASTSAGQDQIKVIDVQGALSDPVRNEILALKVPPLLSFEPKTSYGALSAPTDNLVPADAKYFGGKAATFGLLRRTIPNSSPPAIAFSFDLWDQFLDQTLPNGKTLRTDIAERLVPYTTYPPDMAALRMTLAAIRDLITGTARFSPAQQQAVLNALSVFDPAQKIRFRSSTNMEDAEQFTGAGLYDSFSGCLLDDLDGDTAGPCGCDPTEPNERGVFRAIQKVYASFYNDNAFLERLRHQVNESQVGMALLVHHSFPDEEANGVATLDATYFSSTASYAADLVTQIGEVSVTNPEGDALPELVHASQFGAAASLTLKNRSSLVPLGAYVLNWDADYRALMNLLVTVTNGYRLLQPGKTRFLLDFEYKKESGAMIVKQVRPLPLPSGTGTVVPFLINEPSEYCVFQGEYADVFSNHRLKSQWTLRTRSLRLTDANLQQSFYANSQLDYVDSGTVSRLEGSPSGWPGAAYSISGNVAQDRWVLGTGADQRVFQLETSVIREVNEAKSPLFTQADFSKLFSVTYATPIPKISQSGSITTTTQERVRLVPWPMRTASSLLQSRNLSVGGIGIQTSFFWPEDPHLAAGYTAPLVEWVETRITGLTNEPIVLQGYYSQTYRPEHHNFGESFIFEPRLEEGISSEALAELISANIQLLHCVRRASGGIEISALGFDGQFRRLP
jgi:Pyruvate phosphate dikinase, AMP/ATP-binding domain